MDKGVAKTFFFYSLWNTDVQRNHMKEERQDAAKKAEIHYPCVVKPACGGVFCGSHTVEDPGYLRRP